ncbi:MAG: trypsin-like peptidase domain-containing protein [Bacteriovoracaceae bacterium]|nr:trypsin-like peptidase domain-containing protein [Bacteriovoracaceae bacterium]
MRINALVCSLFVFILTINLSQAQFFGGVPEVIYGEDNRLDYYQETNPALLELSNSTVALVKRADLTEVSGLFKVPTGTLGDSYNLCPAEPFRDQPNPAFCSGFLVGADIVITAGHCITNQASCDDIAFIFGFHTQAPQQVTTQFAPLDVYYCKELKGRAQEARGADWAVVQLDRAVADRTPLSMRSSGTISVGEPLVVIGHPSGLPTKIAEGANVRSIESSKGYLVANLDTYGGNSGSAVFNRDTLNIEGILVRGETDYVTSGQCRVSNRCQDDACRGEDVTLISEVCNAHADVCQATTPTPPTPPVPPTPPTPPVDNSNSCRYANDGVCDDGRPGAPYNVCAAGTDENDCSAAPDTSNSCRYANDGVCDDGRPGAPYNVCAAQTDENDCASLSENNTCRYAHDGECDDGRPGAAYNVCDFGTDTADCREI